MQLIFYAMDLAFKTVSLKIEEHQISCGFLELQNAIIALFWEEGEPKLGSTTMALPKTTPTQILGDRDLTLGRVIASYIAEKYNKISFISINISFGYSEGLGKALLMMVDSVKVKDVE